MPERGGIASVAMGMILGFLCGNNARIAFWFNVFWALSRRVFNKAGL